LSVVANRKLARNGLRGTLERIILRRHWKQACGKRNEVSDRIVGKPKLGAGAIMSLFLTHFPCSPSCYFPARSLLQFHDRKPLTPVFTWDRCDQRPSAGQNSLYFSLLSGILARDGFAADCVLRQTVCSSENCSLISHEFAAFRGFLSIGRARNRHWHGLRKLSFAFFSTRLVTSPFPHIAKT
jgi:hypothetical protein